MRWFRRRPTIGLVVAAVLVVAGPALAADSADLAITRMTGPRVARVGDTIAVTIAAVGRTQQSDLLLDQIVGVSFSDNLALGAGGIDCNGALAASDGFNCEPGSLPPYQSFLTVAHLVVLGGGSRFGQVTACTWSGNILVDPQPRNNCRTIKIVIVGKPGPAKTASAPNKKHSLGFK
jgi:hypothetical protein